MKIVLLQKQDLVFHVALMCNLEASTRKQASSCCNCSASLPRMITAPYLQAW